MLPACCRCCGSPPKGRLAIPQPSRAPGIPVAKDLQEPGGFCRAACEKPLPPSWSCWRKARRAASIGCSPRAAGGGGRGASPLGNAGSAPSDLYSPCASFVSLISFSQGAQPMHVPTTGPAAAAREPWRDFSSSPGDRHTARRAPRAKHKVLYTAIALSSVFQLNIFFFLPSW